MFSFHVPLSGKITNMPYAYYVLTEYYFDNLVSTHTFVVLALVVFYILVLHFIGKITLYLSYYSSLF